MCVEGFDAFFLLRRNIKVNFMAELYLKLIEFVKLKPLDLGRKINCNDVRKIFFNRTKIEAYQSIYMVQYINEMIKLTDNKLKEQIFFQAVESGKFAIIAVLLYLGASNLQIYDRYNLTTGHTIFSGSYGFEAYSLMCRFYRDTDDILEYNKLKEYAGFDFIHN